MNKRDIIATRKHMAALIVVVIIILTIVAGFSAVQAVSQHTISQRLDSEYNTISMPASIQFQSKTYNSRPWWNNSPGIKENMVYTYKPASPALTINQAHQVIASAITTAGYSVDAQPDPSPISFSAHNDGFTVLVTINGQGDSSDGSAPVQDVEVQIYE